MGLRNKRLMKTLAKAVKMDFRGGCYPLDAYNDNVLTDGVIFAVTTRTFGDNNHWLMEVYESIHKQESAEELREGGMV